VLLLFFVFFAIRDAMAEFNILIIFNFGLRYAPLHFSPALYDYITGILGFGLILTVSPLGDSCAMRPNRMPRREPFSGPHTTHRVIGCNKITH